ncbi:MAG: peptidoglycan DD-metalloendopeptidase family protein [Coriobacteriia bacterium]|nr:peptidoglycan DD-metalloendopeptidase family protein [Coriobacteriia bacterium]
MFRHLGYVIASWLVLGALCPAVAGAGWPLETAVDVTLGYGVGYAFGDGESIHRGVDLASDPGDTVLAPFAGRVSFAGRVPAEGGGTCGAVTIEFGDGLKVTCLPLDDVRVAAGTPVESGSVIGLLAASGDRSSSQPHLHIGVRRGDTYLDPMSFLLAPVAAPSAETPDATAPHGASIPQNVNPSAEPVGAAGTLSSVSVGVPAASVQPAATTGAPHIASAAVPDEVTVHAPVTSKVLAEGFTPAPRSVVATRRIEQMERVLSSGTRASDGVHTTTVARGEAVTYERPAAMPMSVPGLLLIGVGALLGLSPIWRSQSQKPQRSAVPTGDDFAAAVGR